MSSRAEPEGQELLQHLEEQVQILILAANDMDEVIAACDALEQEEPTHLGGALETAIAVCYARPFSSSNAVGHLGRGYWPRVGSDKRELHDWLVEQRRRRYAHSDLGRVVLHQGDPETTGLDGFIEMSAPYPKERLPAIRALASDLRERLLREATAVQRRIEDIFMGR
jgi:hypothetical protein